MTLSIMTLDIGFCYAECRDYLNVMLVVVMLSVMVPLQALDNFT
jgi:hypothetical protein